MDVQIKADVSWRPVVPIPVSISASALSHNQSPIDSSIAPQLPMSAVPSGEPVAPKPQRRTPATRPTTGSDGNGSASTASLATDARVSRAIGELRSPSDCRGVHRAFEQQLRLQPLLARRTFTSCGDSSPSREAGGAIHVDVNAEVVNRTSYAQLNACANVLARLLKQRLQQLDAYYENSQQLVVVCMSPRLERCVAVLALWKLGLAFVPLDRSVGTDRAAAIIEDARPIAALTMPESRDLLLEATAKLTFPVDVLLLTNIVPHFCLFERDYIDTPQTLPPTRRESPQSGGTQRLLFVDFERASSARYLSSYGLESYVENLRDDEMLVRDVFPPAEGAAAQPYPNELNARSLAVVLFTSGSTGKPKGVRLTQANLVARLEWQWTCVPFDARDVLLQKTSFPFVDSITETFGAIGRLVPLVIAPHQIAAPATFEQFAHIVQRYRVTRLVMVPTPWQSFCNYLLRTARPSLSTVSTVVLSGEALRAAVVNLTFDVWALSTPESGVSDKRPLRRQVLNFYGSSETTGDVTYEVFDRHIADPNVDLVSIGSPMWNTCAYVVNEMGEIVNDGVEGELYIAGAHVGDGYLVEPDAATASVTDTSVNATPSKSSVNNVSSVMSLNAESPFRENAFDAAERLRHMYRTGDLCVMRDGKLSLRGRADAQVKLFGGHRVHLSEVEWALVQAFEHFGVDIDKALALLVEHSPTHRRQHSNDNVELRDRLQVIVVFYVVRNGRDVHDTVGEQKLLDAIYKQVKMPRAVFAFKPVDQFPLQSHSGKVDRLRMRTEAKQLVSRRYDQLSLQERLAKHTEHVDRCVYQALYEATDTQFELTDDMELNCIGLDSLTTVNFIEILKELGIQIAGVPEEVTPGRQLRTIHDLIDFCRLRYSPGAIAPVAASASAGDSRFPSWARVETLRDEQHDEVAAVFGPAFARGVQLHVFLQLTVKKLVDFNGRMFWPHCLTSGCSFVVRDTRQPAAPIVALVLALDAEHFDEYMAAHADEMQTYLKSVCFELRALGHMFEQADHLWERFNAEEHRKRGSAWPAATADRPHRGHWLDINAVCVDFSWLSDAARSLDRAQLSLAMEPHCHDLARRHEYIGVKTINMEDSTRGLSKQLGLRVLQELDLRGTEYAGRKPFEQLNSECRANMAYKYL